MSVMKTIQYVQVHAPMSTTNEDEDDGRKQNPRFSGMIFFNVYMRIACGLQQSSLTVVKHIGDTNASKATLGTNERSPSSLLLLLSIAKERRV